MSLKKIIWLYYWMMYTFRKNKKNNICRTKFANRQFLTPEETNQYLMDKINTGKPFMVCRIGANESFSLRTYEFKHTANYEKALTQLCTCAGFFPNELSSAEHFLNIMKSSMHSMDLCGSLLCPLDDYFINKFAPKTCVTSLLDSIDSTDRITPWTSQLKNKRVLVIHPFSKTIEMQYKKREMLFPGRNVLPEFTLITYQAIQTSAGQKDSRFSTWWEALDFMSSEIEKIDFDIALLGCGAYGLPLAARIKNMEKQAVQIGGSLQILFGIKGKRWDKDPGTTKFYNEAWVYPLDEETPAGAIQVEGACYWK